MAGKVTSVDEYMSGFPDDIKKKLESLRKVIHEEVPETEEGIGYMMPAFRYNGTYFMYFAAWKSHVSIYPYSAEIEDKLPESKKYKTSGKGTIQFPLDKPLPLPFIRKIIRFLLEKNKERAKKK